MGTYVGAVALLLMIWLVVGVWRLRRRRVVVGPAAGAAMTALMDDQRRAALEVVIEERTAVRDLQHADDISRQPRKEPRAWSPAPEPKAQSLKPKA